MLGRTYSLFDLKSGITAYLMHHDQQEPGYGSLQYVDVVYVDKDIVVLFKHGGNNFYYSNGMYKSHLVLKIHNYNKNWHLTK